MNFLNPSLFWWLLPLVALPWIIHWLSRRFPKKFAFSSIEEIRRTLAGRSRLFRWRHWLLLALRTLALLVLLAAFLKPIIATRIHPSGKQRHLILMVDHSLSMSHAAEGATALSRAHAEVRRLLDSCDADDRFQLIRVDHAPSPAFPDFTTDRSAALDYLRDSPPPMTHADFQSANRLAAELSRRSGVTPDIYYFSDFQRRDWADVRFDSLPGKSRLYFIHTAGKSERENRAITRIELGEGAVIAGSEVEASIRVANYSPHPWTGKVEAGFGPGHLREAEIILTPWAESDVKIPLPVPDGGLLSLEATLPPDALPADNRHSLVIRVQEREEVALLTGPAEDPSSPAPSLFLTTAVNPFEDEKGSYRPRHLTPGELHPTSLASTRRLIASRLPQLDETRLTTLSSFLRAGGGVIWFLDGTADRPNLEGLAAISGSPLPIRLTEKLDSTHLPDGAMRVARGDFRSRFLRLFDGERRQNLGLLEFYDLYHAAPTGQGNILLTYADGTPALTECQIGLGTLLLCNFSVAEASSNLARQRLFPAWIHEMLLRMDGANRSAAQEPFLPGDSISGETWSAESTGRDLVGPAGPVPKVRRETLGERMRLHFTPILPGIYQMSGNDRRTLLAFAVNPDTGQSDLRSIDPAILPDRAGNERPEASFLGTTTDYESLLRGRPVFHWFVIAAIVLLLVEGCLFKGSTRRTPSA